MYGKSSIDSKKIQRNYFIVAVILGLLIVLIAGRVFKTSFVEGKLWREKSINVLHHTSIPATRGNIFSSDGELMAVSESYYRLYIDFGRKV